MNLLPNFFIIGAMKSGTSSLHHFLSAQEDFGMSSIKEPNFYAKARTPFHKSSSWYKGLFSEAKWRGESSTAYTKYPFVKKVPSRIKKQVPDAKFIYIMRDPIERSLSHITHEMLEGQIGISKEADKFVTDTKSPFVQFSLYGLQLQQYLEHFDKSRILLLDFHELKSNPSSCVQDIFNFLGHNANIRSDVFSEKRNVSAERKAISDYKHYKKVMKKEGFEAAQTLRVEMDTPKFSDTTIDKLNKIYSRDLKFIEANFHSHPEWIKTYSNL